MSNDVTHLLKQSRLTGRYRYPLMQMHRGDYFDVAQTRGNLARNIHNWVRRHEDDVTLFTLTLLDRENSIYRVQRVR